MNAETAVVTVYTKPACVQCNATYRALDKAGISYESVDVTASPEALEYVQDLGYSQAPGDDPVATLAGRTLRAAHGRRDRITSFRETARYVERARSVADTAELRDMGALGH